MFVDGVCIKKWDVVEKTKIRCTKERLKWRAEECLVHVFNPVLDVCDSVDIVGTVGREGVMLRSVSRRCGMLWRQIL